MSEIEMIIFFICFKGEIDTNSVNNTLILQNDFRNERTRLHWFLDYELRMIFNSNHLFYLYIKDMTHQFLSVLAEKVETLSGKGVNNGFNLQEKGVLQTLIKDQLKTQQELCEKLLFNSFRTKILQIFAPKAN